MSYIYKIINNINGKLYVGKTSRNLPLRFKEHVTCSKNKDISNRPLYKAFAKYGHENFSIELIEEVSEDLVNEREIYWIENLCTFKNGYNATTGGDGRLYIDRNIVISTYYELGVLNQVAKHLNISADTVSSILKENNIDTPKSTESTAKFYQKVIKIFKKDNSLVGTFSNGSEAARWLIEHGYVAKTSQVKHISTKILSVCNGKRKSCYGLICKIIT